MTRKLDGEDRDILKMVYEHWYMVGKPMRLHPSDRADSLVRSGHLSVVAPGDYYLPTTLCESVVDQWDEEQKGDTRPKAFRKKPVEIQAMQLTDAHSVSLAARWCSGSNAKSPHEVQIETLEGVMTASLGDWIIRGVQGEFYPCKPDIFEQTYEQVSS